MERKTGWNDYTERLDLYHSTKNPGKKVIVVRNSSEHPMENCS